MYMDSPVKALVCQYRTGIACLEAGSYEEALSWLEPLGSYEDAQQQVLIAKWQWLHTAIQSAGGEMKVQAGTEGGWVSLTANEDGSLAVGYQNEGLLLGVPYENLFTMTVTQGQREAAYTASYLSTSISKIQEEASGILDVALFTATANLPVDAFTQVNTDPDGVETVSNDTKDALMMQVVLAEIQAAVAEGLPVLLSESGVDITLQEMGFASL